MTDDTTTTPDGPSGRIEPVELQTEMQRAYIDYAMAVIVGRALPDVRDGLKPVHRRVLYAMYDGGYRPDRGFSKCSRVQTTPSATSRRLCGGMFVAIPTAIPEPPLTSRLGKRLGRRSGSCVLPA